MFDELIAKVPGIPRTATDGFVVGVDGTLSSSDRKILRYLVKSAVPDVSTTLLASVQTLGELRSVVESRAQAPEAPEGDAAALLDLDAYVAHSVFMRPVMPQDHEQLYFASLDPSNSFRWRYRGQTVSFPEFSQSLAIGALAQFAFADPDSGGLVAFCSAYNYDTVSRHATFAVQRLDFDERFDTAVIESVALFLNYLFRTFNLRKVFADIPEYNFPIFGLVKDVFELEGEKRDYYWHAGRYWSEKTISTSVEAWTTFAAQFFTERR